MTHWSAPQSPDRNSGIYRSAYLQSAASVPRTLSSTVTAVRWYFSFGSSRTMALSLAASNREACLKHLCKRLGKPLRLPHASVWSLPSVWTAQLATCLSAQAQQCSRSPRAARQVGRTTIFLQTRPQDRFCSWSRHCPQAPSLIASWTYLWCVGFIRGGIFGLLNLFDWRCLFNWRSLFNWLSLLFALFAFFVLFYVLLTCAFLLLAFRFDLGFFLQFELFVPFLLD